MGTGGFILALLLSILIGMVTPLNGGSNPGLIGTLMVVEVDFLA
jgi:hypothetical protein